MGPAPSTPGWVYILSNKALPGMVKIGLTTKNPPDRAADLTRATGIPLPFKVEWARAVSDCAFVEKAVHRMLDDKRVRGKIAAGAKQEAEFFRVDVTTGRQVIEAAAGAYLGRPYRAMPAPLRRNGRRKGRGRRRRPGDGLAVALLVSVAVLLVLLFAKPRLPSWLPLPLQTAFVTVESIGG